MAHDTDDADAARLRERLTQLLAGGLQTQTTPMPTDTPEHDALVNRCAELPADDLIGKLVLTGWTHQPQGEDGMRCQECMYFLVNRRWCDLPALNLPAEPDWWCRLWRI